MRKKFLYIIVILFLVVIFVGGYKFFELREEKIQLAIENREKENKLNELKNNYNRYVIVSEESFLYENIDGEYVKVGKINEGVELILEDILKLTVDIEYFKIDTFGGIYYISYKDVKPIEEVSLVDSRYKRYVVFNKNIVTDDSFKLYSDDNYVLELNKSFDFSIIYKDGDKYYIEYGDALYYVKKEDVVSEYDNHNTDEVYAEKVRTLVYHRIYDPETEKCNEVICHKEEDFDIQMKYLNDNDYLSLTMKELELFIDGNLQIPEKSIVITIDDGTMDKRAIPILEKYKVNAILFLVTSRFKEQDYIDFTSEYLELHSHTHNMHWAGECSGYGSQGGGILCLSEEHVLEDLKTSREILGGSTVFCYPFYDYSDRAIRLLKQAGFTMAFAGEQGSGGYSYVGTDKMLIPRLTLNSYTTYNMFVSYVD